MNMLGREQVLPTSQCPLPQHLPASLLQPWQRATTTAVTAGLPATNGSSIQQSIACPELDFVPIELWGMEDSAALGRSPVAQHAKQAGPVPRPRVKQRSARLWLCVLVCDCGAFPKAREAKPGGEKHPFVLLCIYSFAHFLIHSLNYSLLKQGFYSFII